MIETHQQGLIKLIAEQKETVSKQAMEGNALDCRYVTTEIEVLVKDVLKKLVLEGHLDEKSSDSISDEFTTDSALIVKKYNNIKEKKLNAIKSSLERRSKKRREKLKSKQEDEMKKVRFAKAVLGVSHSCNLQFRWTIIKFCFCSGSIGKIKCTCN